MAFFLTVPLSISYDLSVMSYQLSVAAGRPARMTVRAGGLEFPNPFILAAGPLTRSESAIRKCFQAGWGGAVTKTIALRPTISPRPALASLRKSKSLVNIELISEVRYPVWLRWIKNIKHKFPDRILLASIMGDARMADWVKLARACESAGADALELNVSCPHGMPECGMGALIGQNPYLVKKITQITKKAVRIPVWVKLTPNVTDLGLIARAGIEGGADGLVGINTVKALAGIDIDSFTPLPNVSRLSTFGGYSGQAIKPIALRCVAEMASEVREQKSEIGISAVGGISNWHDAVEFMLLGASTVQICTAAMYQGISMIKSLKKGLLLYLKRQGLDSVNALVGLGLDKIIPHSDLTFDPMEI